MNSVEKAKLSSQIVKLATIQTRTTDLSAKAEIQAIINELATLIENATDDREYRREVPSSGKPHFPDKDLTKRGRA